VSRARRPKKATGEGTVYKRADGRWTAQVYVDQSDGTRKHRTLYGRTRREVEDKMLELRRRSDAGTPIPPPELTVGAYLQEWLDNVVSARVRANTLAGYRYHAERYLIPSESPRVSWRLD
jgi:integrase